MTAFAPTAALEPDAAAPVVLALPKGRILEGVRPAAGARRHSPRRRTTTTRTAARLRFPTDDPGLDVVRVRPFDVATFVAFGAAQLGICGADVLMEFDYPEIYAPLDLGIGACRVSVAEPARDRRQR